MLCLKVDHLPWDINNSSLAMIHQSTSRPLQSPGATTAAPAPPRSETPNMILPQNTRFCCSSADMQQVGQESIPAPTSTKMVVHNKRRSSTEANKHAILFPTKLRCILDDAVTEGHEHIVSWLPDGTAFKIHNPEAFTKVILRRYFRQTMFKSFTRQLYHYGFSKLNDDLDHNTFSHPQFRRDDYESCLTIDRKKHKNTSASHMHTPMMKGGQICSSSPSSPHTTSPINVTPMPVQQTLILDEKESSLQTSLSLRHDHPRAFQHPQSFGSGRGADADCIFQDHKEKSSVMFDISKTTTTSSSSSDDWFGRLEHCFQVATGNEQENHDHHHQQQQQQSYHVSVDSIAALTILEPRTLEEMTLFPISIPSIIGTIHQGL